MHSSHTCRHPWTLNVRAGREERSLPSWCPTGIPAFQRCTSLPTGLRVWCGCGWQCCLFPLHGFGGTALNSWTSKAAPSLLKRRWGLKWRKSPTLYLETISASTFQHLNYRRLELFPITSIYQVLKAFIGCLEGQTFQICRILLFLPNKLHQFWTVFIKVKQALKGICVPCSYLCLCPGLTWDETDTANFLDPSSWEFLAFCQHLSLCTVNSLIVATTATIGESVQNHYWTKAINIFLDSHSHCKIHAE